MHLPSGQNDVLKKRRTSVHPAILTKFSHLTGESGLCWYNSKFRDNSQICRPTYNMREMLPPTFNRGQCTRTQKTAFSSLMTTLWPWFPHWLWTSCMHVSISSTQVISEGRFAYHCFELHNNLHFRVQPHRTWSPLKPFMTNNLSSQISSDQSSVPISFTFMISWLTLP